MVRERRVTRDQLERWVSSYERAWRTPGIDAVAELFAAGATYRTAPYEEPYRGLDAIERFWEAGRDGPDEAFDMRSSIVAVEAHVGVVRVEVRYSGPPPREYRDLWVVELDADGRCMSFEEWPFSPLHEGWFEPGPAR